MASVRDTVYEMMTLYPSLYKTKSSCFHHLFFVIGNGYEWEDGELVYFHREKTKIEFKDEDEVIRKSGLLTDLHPDINDKYYDSFRLRTRETNAALQFTLDNFDVIMSGEHLAFGNMYPYSSKYNHLTHMPDDAKPDWREAIEECLWALTPYFNSFAGSGAEMTKEKAIAMAKDIQRFKEEKFPEFLKRQKKFSEMIKDILKEV